MDGNTNLIYDEECEDYWKFEQYLNENEENEKEFKIKQKMKKFKNKKIEPSSANKCSTKEIEEKYNKKKQQQKFGCRSESENRFFKNTFGKMCEDATQSNRSILSNYNHKEIDMVSEILKFGVEFVGDVFHLHSSDKKKYEHYNKIKYAKEKGYKLIYIKFEQAIGRKFFVNIHKTLKAKNPNIYLKPVVSKYRVTRRELFKHIAPVIGYENTVDHFRKIKFEKYIPKTINLKDYKFDDQKELLFWEDMPPHGYITDKKSTSELIIQLLEWSEKNSMNYLFSTKVNPNYKFLSLFLYESDFLKRKTKTKITSTFPKMQIQYEIKDNECTIHRFAIQYSSYVKNGNLFEFVCKGLRDRYPNLQNIYLRLENYFQNLTDDYLYSNGNPIFIRNDDIKNNFYEEPNLVIKNTNTFQIMDYKNTENGYLFLEDGNKIPMVPPKTGKLEPYGYMYDAGSTYVKLIY